MLDLPFHVAGYKNITEIIAGIQQEIAINWLEAP
jgi:hypothetical protein